MALSRVQGLLSRAVDDRITIGALLRFEPDALDASMQKGRSATIKGYGRELIERALPYALGAGTRYELDDAGVRRSIDVPLTRALIKGDPP